MKDKWHTNTHYISSNTPIPAHFFFRSDLKATSIPLKQLK